MLTTHLVQEISWGKALGSNFMEDTWAGEVGNVEKPVGVQRVREASKNIHQPRKKSKALTYACQ